VPVLRACAADCPSQGAAMLWVHPSKQAAVHPTVVSHG
jgi:hypothetical protein